MSPTGQYLSKYSADDPRSVRAVWKLGMAGPEVDNGSASNTLTTGATSLSDFKFVTELCTDTLTIVSKHHVQFSYLELQSATTQNGSSSPDRI